MDLAHSSAASSRVSSPSAVVAICLVVAVLEGYDIQAMGVAAPQLRPLLHLAADQMGWAFSASMIGLILGAVAGGWTADRVGRKPVLVAAIAAFGLFSLATIVVTDFWTLFAARVLTGLGLGGALPNLLALATEISPKGKRVGTATIMCCGLPIGGALVSLTARYALPHFGWRIVFLIGGLLPLLVAPVALMLKTPARPRADLSEAEAMRTLPALFGGGRASATLLLWISYPLTIVVMYLMLNWLPLLIVAKGLPATAGATAALSFNLFSAIGSILIGRIVDRYGVRWPMLVTYAALLAVMIGLASASGYGVILALAGAAGFFVSGGQYTLYGITPGYYPPRLRGTGTGWAVGVGRIGSVVGPILAGQLLAAGASAYTVVLSTAPGILVAGGAVLLLTFIGREHEDLGPIG